MEKQNSNKVKLLCSYGGKIQTRPSDHQLCYVGGDTKILAVERNVSFVEIVKKLNSLIQPNENTDIAIKYQFPGEDLDALVSIIDDDDVEHMMIEYDRMQRITSKKPNRLRMFIFDVTITTLPTVKTSVKDTVSGTVSGNPDYLFGFDKEYKPSIGPPLDLLQIPGMVLPQNYELVPRVKNNVTRGNNGNSDGNVYRIPVVGNGGVYQTGQYAYGVVTGNRDQPVYNFVPVVESVVVELERKVNQQQHIF